MTETIDVTGLPKPLVESLRRVVESVRDHAGVLSEVANGQSALSNEEWINLWESHAKQYRRIDHFVDDSRESIYSGRGE